MNSLFAQQLKPYFRESNSRDLSDEVTFKQSWRIKSQATLKSWGNRTCRRNRRKPCKRLNHWEGASNEPERQSYGLQAAGVKYDFSF